MISAVDADDVLLDCFVDRFEELLNNVALILSVFRCMVVGLTPLNACHFYSTFITSPIYKRYITAQSRAEEEIDDD